MKDREARADIEWMKRALSIHRDAIDEINDRLFALMNYLEVEIVPAPRASSEVYFSSSAKGQIVRDYEPDFFENVNGTLVNRRCDSLEEILQGNYPQRPGFKRAGTSSQAAAELAPGTATLRALVLAEIRRNPVTADQCAASIGRSVLAVRPRLSELNAMGKIVETSERRRNMSGKMAAVWRAL